MDIMSQHRITIGGCSLSTTTFRLYNLLNLVSRREALCHATSVQSTSGSDPVFDMVMKEHLFDRSLFKYIRSCESHLTFKQIAEIYVKIWLLESELILSMLQSSKYYPFLFHYDCIDYREFASICRIPFKYSSYIYGRLYYYSPSIGISFCDVKDKTLSSTEHTLLDYCPFEERIEPDINYSSKLEAAIKQPLPTLTSVPVYNFLVCEEPEYWPVYRSDFVYSNKDLFYKSLQHFARPSDSDSEDEWVDANLAQPCE